MLLLNPKLKSVQSQDGMYAISSSKDHEDHLTENAWFIDMQKGFDWLDRNHPVKCLLHVNELEQLHFNISIQSPQERDI